jgi:hypothetical protein
MKTLTRLVDKAVDVVKGNPKYEVISGFVTGTANEDGKPIDYFTLAERKGEKREWDIFVEDGFYGRPIEVGDRITLIRRDYKGKKDVAALRNFNQNWVYGVDNL